jgi:hypothetical protein
MILWRVSDEKYKTRFIRAENLNEAKRIFDADSYTSAVTIEPTEEIIQAVYFTDNPNDPAYFKGTKAKARKGGNLYIRQWQLDAKIDRIETM